MLELATLITAGIGPTQARAFQPHLSVACSLFDINNVARLAGFIAQCHIESDGFTQLEEGLWYRDPVRIRAIFPSSVKTADQAAALVRNPQALANTVYANRLGNGPVASGDGWRYRGRGLKQLTGRANYAQAASALARPYVESPELVALPEDASLTAAWFWAANGCNALADAQQWDAITRKVNGPGMLKAKERRVMSGQILKALW